ncbi:MAG: hypothetical protein R3B36_14385 [Polyangiaceae bacterium]
MKRRALVVTALAVLATSTSASGDEGPRYFRLRYSAPSACPSRAWLEGALHFRSPRLVPADDEAARVDYSIDVALTTTGDETIHGELQVGQPGSEPTVRTIDGERCESVVAAFAFSVALLLDPEGVNQAGLPSADELARLAEQARVKSAPPPVPPPPPPATPAPAAGARATPQPPSAAPRVSAAVELGVGAWSGVSGLAPRVDGAFEVRLGRDLAPYARLTGYFSPRDETSGATGTIAYTPAGARIDVGLLALTRAHVSIGGGPHVSLLVMPVDAPSAQERLPSVRVVPSVGALARATWEPSTVGLAVEAGGGAHLSREGLSIDSVGAVTSREVVLRLPAIYGLATLGLIVRFGADGAPTRASAAVGRFRDPKSPVAR